MIKNNWFIVRFMAAIFAVLDLVRDILKCVILLLGNPVSLGLIVAIVVSMLVV